MPVRAVRSSPYWLAQRRLVRTPLMGFIQRSPLHQSKHDVSTPGLTEIAPGPEAATLQARSAPVVPPDFDGLLHTTPCGSIAPRNQPWGSPCFRSVSACFRRSLLTPTFPNGAYPSKLFPPWQLSRVTAVFALSSLEDQVNLLCVATAQVSPLFPTSGPCSTKESVACGLALPPFRCSMLPWALSLKDRRTAYP